MTILSLQDSLTVLTGIFVALLGLGTAFFLTLWVWYKVVDGLLRLSCMHVAIASYVWRVKLYRVWYYRADPLNDPRRSGPPRCLACMVEEHREQERQRALNREKLREEVAQARQNENQEVR